ncbi:hypothetical protein [Pseudomonas sp. DY-1]|uniref:hypothetical protein n=1 Tax=Pseudomonas sp. DY-1 TaxID=1755504 RepID=UPI0015AC9800|nr:hypothetical protein [Pseudomonas sp. DY-1]
MTADSGRAGLATLLAKVEHGAITAPARTSMRSIHLLCAGLALTLLAACDRDAPSQPKSPPAPPPISASPEPARSASEPAAPVEPPPVPESKPVPPPPVPTPKPVPSPPAPVKPKEPPVAASTEAPLPKAKLDLTLPKGLVDQLQPSEATADLPDQPLLPQMFVEKPAPESPFQLNGKLITNEREDDYWRSVEGAELQFEFKR